MDAMLYKTTAPHIRGRVYKRADRFSGNVWELEVINTKTGKVLATDNCSVYETLADLSIEAVGAYRAAWFWGISKKDTKG